MVGLVRRFVLSVLLVSSTLVCSATGQTNEPPASQRHSMFRQYLEFPSFVDGGVVQAHWLTDGSRFWYAEDGTDGREIYRVAPSLGTSRLLKNSELDLG